VYKDYFKTRQNLSAEDKLENLKMLSTQFYNQRVDIVNTELFTLFE